MAFGLPLLMALGASGLTVHTDSPDALCPPLPEARKVIQARVGQVQGGTYEARYGVVYDAESGQNALHLVLLEADTPVLERDIPLRDVSCAEAALAMALVLERYFESAFELQKDEESPPTASALPDESSSPPPPASSQPAERSEPAPSEPADEPATQGAAQASRVILRAFLDIARYGVLQTGVGLEAEMSSTWSTFVDARFQVFRAKIESNGYEVGAFRHGLTVSPSYVFRWVEEGAFYVGPSLGVQLQVVEALDEELLSRAGSKTRVVPTVGAQLGAGWDLGRRFQLGVFGKGLVLLGGTSFVVTRGEQERAVVLELPELTWEVGFSWGIRL